MLWLALPVLLEQLLSMLVGLSDRVITGYYLETSHLAAINLMAYVLWLVYEMFAVVAIGGTAMVARFVGAGDLEAAQRVANQALVIGAVMAVVGVIFWALAGGWAIGLLGLHAEAAQQALLYIRIVLPVIPLIMIEAVGIACLRGAGDMMAGLVTMAIVNLVNIALSWSLVLGLGPLPPMGWRGIALGTATGYAVGGLIVLRLLLKGRSGLAIRREFLRPDWDLMRRLLRIGLPGGVDTLSIITCQLWFVSIINGLGDRAAAAHGVAIGIESLAFLPGVAFQAAAATLVGQYLGAGQPRKAARSAAMTCLVGGGLMVLAGLLFFTQARWLPHLFLASRHTDVAAMTAPLLQVVGLAMPALAITMILSGALRGAGDTRWPLLFSMIGMLGIRLPLAYWFALDSFRLPFVGIPIAGWNLGVLGAWYAMAADLGVRAVLIFYRFSRGRWQRIGV
ncbi:MAG: MATE family efflux transporter [Thermoguttaceae bacterium]